MISCDGAQYPFRQVVASARIIDNRQHTPSARILAMWIVEVALRRPYTFIVLALLLPIFGLLVILGTPLQKGMPTDIFPDIRIPIIAVTFQYSGMPPDEMAGRISANIERYATTLVNDIEHVESTSYPGVSVVKMFFQP